MSFKAIIYFVGLIAHLQYGNPQRQVAALVAENNHLPRLLVPVGAIRASVNPFRLDKQKNGINYYDISGAGRIQVERISAGSVGWNTDFDTEVKSLKDATKKTTLKSTVQAELPDASSASAFVELHGGDLDVAGYFETNAVYDGADTPCVVSRTSFSPHSNDTTIRFVSDDGHDLVVDGSAQVTFANLPPSAMTGHYKVYANLMEGGDLGMVKKWSLSGSPRKCMKAPIFDPNSLGFKADTADCTNTHFP